jgi:hypothetical protein
MRAARAEHDRARRARESMGTENENGDALPDRTTSLRMDEAEMLDRLILLDPIPNESENSAGNRRN